jgi:hypothetical protein
MSACHKTTRWHKLGLVVSVLRLTVLQKGSGTELELPELRDIRWILRQDEAPSGVVFDIREYDDDALVWLGGPAWSAMWNGSGSVTPSCLSP